MVTIDPIAANTSERFLPFCEALVAHLETTVGGLACAFNQSIGVKPRAMGSAVRENPGAKDFLVKRALMDPHGRFLNPFLQEVLAGVGEVPSMSKLPQANGARSAKLSDYASKNEVWNST